MFARRCIEAGVGQHQTLDRSAADNVGLDNFIDVGFGHVSIPNALRIDHQIGSVLALIEAARLVGSHPSLEAAFRQFLFK